MTISFRIILRLIFFIKFHWEVIKTDDHLCNSFVFLNCNSVCSSIINTCSNNQCQPKDLGKCQLINILSASNKPLLILMRGVEYVINFRTKENIDTKVVVNDYDLSGISIEKKNDMLELTNINEIELVFLSKNDILKSKITFMPIVNKKTSDQVSFDSFCTGDLITFDIGTKNIQIKKNEEFSNEFLQYRNQLLIFYYSGTFEVTCTKTDQFQSIVQLNIECDEANDKMFSCINKLCIDKNLFNDGIDDCGDASDEKLITNLDYYIERTAFFSFECSITKSYLLQHTADVKVHKFKLFKETGEAQRLDEFEAAYIKNTYVQISKITNSLIFICSMPNNYRKYTLSPKDFSAFNQPFTFGKFCAHKFSIMQGNNQECDTNNCTSGYVTLLNNQLITTHETQVSYKCSSQKILIEGQLDIKCSITQFTCLSNLFCLHQNRVCDSKNDCIDESDETCSIEQVSVWFPSKLSLKLDKWLDKTEKSVKFMCIEDESPVIQIFNPINDINSNNYFNCNGARFSIINQRFVFEAIDNQLSFEIVLYGKSTIRFQINTNEKNFDRKLIRSNQLCPLGVLSINKATVFCKMTDNNLQFEYTCDILFLDGGFFIFKQEADYNIICESNVFKSEFTIDAKCSNSQYTCSSKQCILSSEKCDGISQCSDNDDEKGCKIYKLETFINGYVKIPLQQFPNKIRIIQSNYVTESIDFSDDSNIKKTNKDKTVHFILEERKLLIKGIKKSMVFSIEYNNLFQNYNVKTISDFTCSNKGFVTILLNNISLKQFLFENMVFTIKDKKFEPTVEGINLISSKNDIIIKDYHVKKDIVVEIVDMDDLSNFFLIKKCYSLYFYCGDGQVIEDNLICNKIEDCLNKIDEKNCQNICDSKNEVCFGTEIKLEKLYVNQIIQTKLCYFVCKINLEIIKSYKSNDLTFEEQDKLINLNLDEITEVEQLYDLFVIIDNTITKVASNKLEMTFIDFVHSLVLLSGFINKVLLNNNKLNEWFHQKIIEQHNEELSSSIKMLSSNNVEIISNPCPSKIYSDKIIISSFKIEGMANAFLITNSLISCNSKFSTFISDADKIEYRLVSSLTYSHSNLKIKSNLRFSLNGCLPKKALLCAHIKNDYLLMNGCELKINNNEFECACTNIVGFGLFEQMKQYTSSYRFKNIISGILIFCTTMTIFLALPQLYFKYLEYQYLKDHNK